MGDRPGGEAGDNVVKLAPACLAGSRTLGQGNPREPHRAGIQSDARTKSEVGLRRKTLMRSRPANGRLIDRRHRRSAPDLTASPCDRAQHRTSGAVTGASRLFPCKRTWKGRCPSPLQELLSSSGAASRSHVAAPLLGATALRAIGFAPLCRRRNKLLPPKPRSRRRAGGMAKAMRAAPIVKRPSGPISEIMRWLN